MFFCFSALYVFTMFSQCSHHPSYLDHSSIHALTNLQRSHGRDDRIYGQLPFLSQLKHESLFSIFISPSRPSTNTEFMSNLCLLGLRDASTLDCLSSLFCICCASPHAKKGPIVKSTAAIPTREIGSLSSSNFFSFSLIDWILFLLFPVHSTGRSRWFPGRSTPQSTVQLNSLHIEARSDIT